MRVFGIAPGSIRTGYGCIERDGRRIAVTDQGRPFVRVVAAAFDAYLPQNRSRHSVAV